jgi:D-serine dehydratase
METPLLYRQLQDQLSQWVQPKDQRHLQGFAEIVAAVLQSGEACLGRWIPYLSKLNPLAGRTSSWARAA